MITTPSLIGLHETDERLIPLPGGKPSPLGRVGLAARRVGIAVGVAGVVLVPLAGGVAAAGPGVPFPPNPILTASVHPPIPPKPICIPCVKATKQPPVVIGTGGATPTTPPAPTTPAPTTPAPTPAPTTKHSTGTGTTKGTSTSGGTGTSTGTSTGTDTTGTSTSTDTDTAAGDAAPLPPVTDPTDPAAEGGAGGSTQLAGSRDSSGGGLADNLPLLAGGGALLVGSLGGLVLFATRRRTGR